MEAVGGVRVCEWREAEAAGLGVKTVTDGRDLVHKEVTKPSRQKCGWNRRR